MTLDHIWIAARSGLAPTLAVAFVLAVLLWLTTARHGLSTELLVFLFAFALLGEVLGVSTGNSREPAVTALLNGVIGLITLLVGYLFQREPSGIRRAAIPLVLVALLIGSFHGSMIGSQMRRDNEDYEPYRQLERDSILLEGALVRGQRIAAFRDSLIAGGMTPEEASSVIRASVEP